jgi:glycosyltransferase involved in cell wall biosynthesis
MSDALTIVCLSSQPWHDGMWTNKQHIMSRLAKRHRVLHVNFGHTSVAQLLRLKREHGELSLHPSALHPKRALAAPATHRADGVTVLDFLAPGLTRLPASHPLKIFSVFDLRTRLLGRYLEREGIRDAILWVYHPGYGGAVADLPHRLVVYDCVDEYSQFPEYRDNAQWLHRREQALCRRADVVFTTAQGLYDDKRALNPDNTYLVHNVGDEEHFRKARDAELAIAPEIARLEGPVVGFVGAVSGYKLDIEWLTALAKARRDWNIVLIGPEGVGDANSDAGPLHAEPNIHLLGHTFICSGTGPTPSCRRTSRASTWR